MKIKKVKDLLPDKYKKGITLEQFKKIRKDANIDIEKQILKERYYEDK